MSHVNSGLRRLGSLGKSRSEKMYDEDSHTDHSADPEDEEVTVMAWSKFQDLLHVNQFFRKLVKCDYPAIHFDWSYLIYGALEFGVDVTTAYLKAHANILKTRLSLDHSLEERLRRKLKKNMDLASEALVHFRNGFPEMMSAISSRHAARMVLNNSKSLMEHMIHEGTVDESEGAKIVQLIETEMKGLRHMVNKSGLRLPKLSDTLKNIVWLEGAGDDTLQKLVAAAKPILFNDGEVMANNDMSGDEHVATEQSFLVIMRGSVEASVEVGSRQKVFDHHGQGSVFGKHFFLTGLKRPTTYTAKGMVYTYQIPGLVFREIMQSREDLEEQMWKYETLRIARNLLMALPQYENLSEAHLNHVGKTWTPKKIPEDCPENMPAGMEVNRIERKSVMVLVHGWCVSHARNARLDLEQVDVQDYFSETQIDQSKYSESMLKLFQERYKNRRMQRDHEADDETLRKASDREQGMGQTNKASTLMHHVTASRHVKHQHADGASVSSNRHAAGLTHLKGVGQTYAAKHMEVPALQRTADHHGITICIDAMLTSFDLRPIASSLAPLEDDGDEAGEPTQSSVAGSLEGCAGESDGFEFANPAFTALNSQRINAARKAQTMIGTGDGEVWGELHSAPCLLMPQPGEFVTFAPGSRILITKQQSIQEIGSQQPGSVLQDAAMWAQGLSKGNLNCLLEKCKPKTYRAGQTLRPQGRKVQHVRLILEGTVQIAVRAEGQMVILEEKLAGTTTGEVAFMCGARRETSLRAKDQVSILEIPFAALEVAMKAAPHMREMMWRTVGIQMGIDLLQQEDLFKHYTTERLAYYLRTWKVVHVDSEQSLSMEEPFLLLKGEAHFIKGEQAKQASASSAKSDQVGQASIESKQTRQSTRAKNLGKAAWAKVRHVSIFSPHSSSATIRIYATHTTAPS
jgi:CRP-like cAMP-binding protein